MLEEKHENGMPELTGGRGGVEFWSAVGGLCPGIGVGVRGLVG